MGYNVLIVDDVSVNRKLIKAILNTKFDNINLFEAEDGVEALSHIVENEIDIIILDLIMPTKDGFDVLKELKCAENTKEIPVIVNSALDDIDSIRKALELGAYDYFTKPLTEEQRSIVLPLKIKNAIKAYEQRKIINETQEQLIITEKMATIGTMVAGVAHEVNTPLAAIKSNIDLEDMLLNNMDENNYKDFAEIKKNIIDMNIVNKMAMNRILEIVKSLKNFARLDEAELKEVNLHEGIDSSIVLVNSEIKGRINIIKEYGQIPLLLCYPVQLNQVFLNIIVNSIQAIKSEGEIVIKTSYKNNKVYISFEDNGCGIPEKNLKKIFNPGFTTKGVGVGTGLGLSISYKIIQKHHGKMIVESIEGVKTKFTIELPVIMK